ncbi:MAG TPA: DNA polymerase Y family protein [Steroidobacteraceae bacterium]|nr:DNA polymerase Y family protein [Steroidobacteraceae bacterium]
MKSRTADLFAAAEYRPTESALAAVGRAGALPASIPVAPPAPLSSAPHIPAPQTPPHTRSRPHSRQLWYAAVFPEMARESSAALLQQICLHAQTFTSFVSIEPPNALLLEIKGSVRLFGSLPRLHADIDACWRQLALPAQSATAPSTLGALWLARAGDPKLVENVEALPGHLAKVPIACTAWDDELLQTLRAMGVTCLSELMRLPRAGLARRLHPARVQDLDIALARQPAPRRAFVPRERFRERCDFDTEIEHVAYLEKALEPLIERCAQFLRERQAGVQALQLRLRHRTAPPTRVPLGLASITSERRRLSDVLCQKLWRLELKAPVRGMELISGPLRGLPASSLDAFAGLTRAGSRDSAPQLVERLRARLGEEAVYGVCLNPEHRPEAAWRRVHDLRLTAAPPKAEEGMIDQGMPRPVWLLCEPLPLSKPQILQGPERIESGWWDGKGVARDYYVARQCGGRKPEPTLWVFQERHSKRWFVHGVFA